VFLDPELGRVRSEDSGGTLLIPVAASVSSEYARPHGRPKVGYKVDLEPTGQISATLGSSLLAFDHFYIVDTNSSETSSGRVAATAVYYAKLRRLDVTSSLLPFEFVGAFDFHDVRANINPERLGWATLVQIVRAAHDYDPRWRIGLVVDSDLGHHAAINDRTEPLHEDFLLPATFRLMYASDAGSDSVFNNVMRMAHRLAADLLKDVREGRIPAVHLRPVPAANLCGSLRIWTRVPSADQAQVTTVPPTENLDSQLRIARKRRSNFTGSRFHRRR
jgi:hypothetical protein